MRRRRLAANWKTICATRSPPERPLPACISLRDDTITGCEALVRWRDPVRVTLSPAEFIPIAEDSGLINQLGEWVLNTACADAAKWPDNIRLAVNVSPIQFKSGTFALKVMTALAASELPANRLELEITEAVLIRATTRPHSTSCISFAPSACGSRSTISAPAIRR
jgi:EAL domain-containing protein (putative c-di-GMP-specific phosphodiesterase class I)